MIIIGNGFDLAHKLPTDYKSFIDFIWSNLFVEYQKGSAQFLSLIYVDNYSKDFFANLKFSKYSDFYELIKNDKNYRIVGKDSDIEIIKEIDSDKTESKIFHFKNDFFKRITFKNIENWVDIENEYYKSLLEIARNGDSKNSSGKTNIETLNNEFLQIKNLLKYYLKQVVEPLLTELNVNEEIKNIFRYNYKKIIKGGNEDYLNEFNFKHKSILVDYDEIFEPSTNISNHRDRYHQNLFLNFNYTSTVSKYVKELNKPSTDGSLGDNQEIQIHGSLEDDINFGFGDEMDDHYKMLEKLDDNKYLEFIKSFMYLENTNYRKLLNWIEANHFQVYILGHSCGNSDRTLLNTIFEHVNCLSIKIFYYEIDDSNDNFRALTQNISRHFNKKVLMREKVVDKSLSLAMPQVTRELV